MKHRWLLYQHFRSDASAECVFVGFRFPDESEKIYAHKLVKLTVKVTKGGSNNRHTRKVFGYHFGVRKPFYKKF